MSNSARENRIRKHRSFFIQVKNWDGSLSMMKASNTVFHFIFKTWICWITITTAVHKKRGNSTCISQEEEKGNEMPFWSFFFFAAQISPNEKVDNYSSRIVWQEDCLHKDPNQNSRKRCLNIKRHRNFLIYLYIFYTTACLYILAEQFVYWGNGLFVELYNLSFPSVLFCK